ncbi:hypothetical protein RM445_30535 [Pseudonocardia sp. DSM 45834]|uniref:Uncharacterized protein n=1 Tax=Pseudonocardia charpentierae TaxID=3075545 RepID=A0ABU2NJR8_9PSEU|nr:hypothetical protein [Pseudonocardia sp. DSM 45834]MDT0353832.1 hypothetical protein [Pseudonocardia sp. DSM 45834]
MLVHRRFLLRVPAVRDATSSRAPYGDDQADDGHNGNPNKLGVTGVGLCGCLSVRKQAQLPEELHLVEVEAMLADQAVFDNDHVAFPDSDLLARRRDALTAGSHQGSSIDPNEVAFVDRHIA